jgi:hypothetical protein
MNVSTLAAGGPAAGSTLSQGRQAASSLAALALSALLAIAAMGAYSVDLQASARLVLITAVIAVLAPLFWPGRAATERATAWRVLGWSMGATLLAAVAGLILGGAPQLGAACLTLLLVCISTHGAAAWSESLLARRGADAAAARHASAWLATTLLALTAAAPLWLGPAAELAAAERPRALQAVVAVSPLTHLAVASGNDLLRNQWFYQHSNLSGLRFDYPRIGPIIAGYALLSLAVLTLPVITRARRATPLRPTSTEGQSS